MRRTKAKDTLRDLRRAQIVSAARALVASGGLDALTFGALEENLGFSRGVITYHFRDKDEIVDELLESALAEIDAATQAQVDASDTPLRKVRAVLEANVRGFLEHRDAGMILLSFWGRLASDEKAKQANAALFAKYRQRTARVLREGRKLGAFGEVEVEPLAAVIVGMVIGLAAQSYFEPASIRLDDAIDEAARSLAARLAQR